MSKQKTLVTMLTWNRLSITQDTLNSFYSLNGNKDILILDNGSTDNTVKWLRSSGYEVISKDKNYGIFLSERELWLEAKKRGYDFILNLQNDFPSIRKVPYRDIELFLDKNIDVGSVRLCQKEKEKKKNFITNEKIRYEKWIKYGETEIAKHNYHFSFYPNFFRTSLVKNLVGKVIKQRERQIMEAYEYLYLKTGKLRKLPFKAVIRDDRPKEWLH